MPRRRSSWTASTLPPLSKYLRARGFSSPSSSPAEAALHRRPETRRPPPQGSRGRKSGTRTSITRRRLGVAVLVGCNLRPRTDGSPPERGAAIIGLGRQEFVGRLPFLHPFFERSQNVYTSVSDAWTISECSAVIHPRNEEKTRKFP